jgi:hypothetical protein
VAGAIVSSSAARTKKSRRKTDSPIHVSTSVGRLTTATVGTCSKLGRKNRAKAEKMNGTSDDGKDDGACML